MNHAQVILDALVNHEIVQLRHLGLKGLDFRIRVGAPKGQIDTILGRARGILVIDAEAKGQTHRKGRLKNQLAALVIQVRGLGAALQHLGSRNGNLGSG